MRMKSVVHVYQASWLLKYGGQVISPFFINLIREISIKTYEIKIQSVGLFYSALKWCRRGVCTVLLAGATGVDVSRPCKGLKRGVGGEGG